MQHVGAYLNHLRGRHYSPATVEQYERTLVRFGVTTDDPTTVSAADIDGFLAGAKIEATTRNARLCALRGFFRFLERQQLVPRSPAADVEFAREPEKTPAFLTFTELLAFLKTIGRVSRYPVRDRAVVAVFFYSAMRVAELASLRLDMLSWERREFVGVRVKGGKVVNLALGPGAEEVVRAWLRERASWRGADTPWLFLSERGSRLSVRQIENLFQRWSKEARLREPISPHGIRHSSTTALRLAGVDLDVAAAVLNHEDVNTTRHYSRMADTRKHAALALLPSLSEAA